MRRRSVLKGLAAIAALPADFLPRVTVPAAAAPLSRVRPGMPGWPAEADWASLNAAVGGRLQTVALPDTGDPTVRRLMSNPFFMSDQAALTQSSGWLDAWRSLPSAYVVAVESAAHVAAAVRFARAHNLRLVVKGRGHSYLGTSNAPDSLLVWTRKMDTVTVHDAFTAEGSGAAPVPAVSTGAGAMWLQAYRTVTAAGRYVQGGGCTTVGVAGLVQGGGFGSFSKAYGIAAASLLEAEVVAADGTIRIVNDARDPDLFWALKGGGGGTFGIVTRLTLATHPLPASFGSVRLTLRARSDEAFRRLLARLVDHYAASLFNPHWGERLSAWPNNRLDVAMTFQSLTADEARAVWQPLIDFVSTNAADYEGLESFTAQAVPAHLFWNAEFYREFAQFAVNFDDRSSASPADFWWRGDGEQVGAFWHAYTSAWMPASLLEPANRGRLVDAWFAASRHWLVNFVFNKGLAGAPPAVIRAARNTAMNPDVLDAFALVIVASEGAPTFAGFPVPDLRAAGARRDRVQAAMAALRTAAPATGSYVNECDYFQPDWQKAFWGPNYPPPRCDQATLRPRGSVRRPPWRRQ